VAETAVAETAVAETAVAETAEMAVAETAVMAVAETAVIDAWFSFRLFVPRGTTATTLHWSGSGSWLWT